jgi:hypothetical protein
MDSSKLDPLWMPKLFGSLATGTIHIIPAPLIRA